MRSGFDFSRRLRRHTIRCDTVGQPGSRRRLRPAAVTPTTLLVSSPCSVGVADNVDRRVREGRHGDNDALDLLGMVGGDLAESSTKLMEFSSTIRTPPVGGVFGLMSAR